MKIICLTLIAFGLSACSDNAANTDAAETDPPDLPSLQEYQPQTEYFSNNNTQEKSIQAGTGFELAAQVMQFTVDPLFSTTNIFMPFFEQAKQADPSFNDGVWEWNYSYSQFEQSADIRLTAEPAGNEDFTWALYISTSSAEGPTFEDYRFMDGRSSSDGSEGNWSIYPYEPDNENASAIVTFDWTSEDENSYSASYNIEGPESSATFSISYNVEDAAEHTLELNSSDGEFDVVVFWNSDTDTGYISQSGDKTCWNSAFENVTCQ